MDLGPDKSLLSVVLPSATLVASPSASYLADEVASTCPLLTPSPPTNALVNPVPEQSESPIPAFLVGDELAIKLNKVTEDDPTAVETSSSNSSELAEPACTQLLNPHHYINLSKSSDVNPIQENGGKPTSLQLTYKKSVEDMCFINWNWPIIRRFCVWGSLSTIAAAVIVVVAMIFTLPKTCSPVLPWYQGSLLYEIFPASFQDSDADGIGDFRGLSSRIDYIKQLGVRGVRLNSIFPATHYPEYFHNITTLFEVDRSLGTIKDFEKLVNNFHSNNISVILDLPIWPLVTRFQPINISTKQNKNNTFNQFLGENDSKEEINTFENVHRVNFDSRENFRVESSYEDLELADREETILSAIRFWLGKGVDGFYLKGLEKFVHDPYFRESIREWKLLLGPEKVLIVNYEVFKLAPSYVMNVLLARVDLVDVKLDFSNGTEAVKHQIETVNSGPFWSRPGTPWIHWSTGSVETHRLSSTLPRQNGTLGAILLQMMLPGTPSLFYGDEIGLTEVSDPEGERSDLRHIHQLTAMMWENAYKQFTRNVLPWLPGQSTHLDFTYKTVIAKMNELRIQNPAIYVNAVWKEGTSTRNSAIRYAKNDVIVIERWYPRRNSFVVVANMGEQKVIVDLSSIFYSGTIMVGPRPNSETEKISFKEMHLWAGESVVVKLDK